MQSRKQQLVRDVIWDAAVDLFSEKGFDETTIEDIAARAGVSRRSFFRYFASKSDLMGQGVITYGEALSKAIAACPPGLTPLDLVRHTVLHIASATAAHSRAGKIIEIADEYPSAREAQLARMADVETRVAQAFAAYPAAAGDWVEPRLLASLTRSILDVTFRLWFERGRKDISASADDVFAMLTQLFTPRGARKPRKPRSRAASKPRRRA